MEGKKYIIILFSILVSFTGWASDKEEIYEAYVTGDMEQWKTLINQMQEEAKNSGEFLIELVNYQYGYIGWCIGEDKKREAKQIMNLAEDNLNKLENMNYAPSEINAYKSAFYGFKIGLSPIKAPVLGPRSINHAKLSVEQDENNPMGYIQYGNAQFYMPAVFGGSKEEAVEYFEKALELMKRSPSKTISNWNYLSLLTLIAQSYEMMNEWDKAELTYKTILETEPRFVYVKDELYPEFLKKKNE